MSPLEMSPPLIFFITAPRSALESLIPSLIACCTSGGNLAKSNVWPGPMWSLAKRARSSFSEELGGQNWKRKLTSGNIAGEVAMSSVGFDQLMAGEAGGAGR